MTIKTLYLAIAAAIAMPAVAAASPNATDKKAAPVRELTEAERTILEHRHHVNVMEIEMGKLAQARGTAPVKAYGAMLVKDHGEADQNVMALAKEKKVKLSDHPTPKTDEEKAAHDRMMARMARLKTLEGAAFDREFAPAMVEGHEKEHARVSGEVAAVTDAKLKALLEKTLPSLRKHADEARKLPGATPAKPKAPAGPQSSAPLDPKRDLITVLK